MMKNKLVNYTVKNQIGKGTSGQIYEVVHNKTGKSYALKISNVSPKRQNETDFLKVIGTHDHIVGLHANFVDQQQIYLILDYYPYGDVLKYLKLMHRPLDETEAKKWIYQIISGVKHLHNKGVVHRDIKLENLVLFISKEYQKTKQNCAVSQLKPKHFSVALIDFDLASTWSNDKYLEKSCGSPFYASPEIFRGTPYSGPEVDMWSVGVVLYCMIANCFPFFGTNILEIAFKVQKGHFSKPRWISSELSSFLYGLLNINRMERFTAEKALQHPWFSDIHKSSAKNHVTPLNPINDSLTNNIPKDQINKSLSPKSKNESLKQPQPPPKKKTSPKKKKKKKS